MDDVESMKKAAVLEPPDGFSSLRQGGLIDFLVLAVSGFRRLEEIPSVVLAALADPFQFPERRAYAVPVIFCPGVGHPAYFHENVVHGHRLPAFQIIPDLLVPSVEDHVAGG